MFYLSQSYSQDIPVKNLDISSVVSLNVYFMFVDTFDLSFLNFH